MKEELRFYISLVDSDPDMHHQSLFATDPISPELAVEASAAPQAVIVEAYFKGSH